MKRLIPLLICAGTALLGFGGDNCGGDRVSVDCDLCQAGYECCPVVNRDGSDGCAGRTQVPGDSLVGINDCTDNTSGKPACTLASCQNVNVYIQVLAYCDSTGLVQEYTVYLCCNLNI